MCKSTISRFWMCWGWEFIIFDERNIFLGPQGPQGTILVPVEIELVPLIGLLPSPRPHVLRENLFNYLYLIMHIHIYIYIHVYI